jgi:hypothetical protein
MRASVIIPKADVLHQALLVPDFGDMYQIRPLNLVRVREIFRNLITNYK